VLHATGLDKVLPLYPDVASAMEAVTPHRPQKIS